MTFWPSTLPPDPLFDAIAERVLAAAAERMNKEWSDMSEKPSGVAAAQAAATDIGLAMQMVEGFEPVKLPQWEAVGKDTDGTPIYRNNWGAYDQWISVAEKMPPLGRYVWAWDGKKVSFTAWTPGDDHRFDSHGITHWMEIVQPSPPSVPQ